MTSWYTTLCQICEHPIRKGAETKGVHSEWSHADKAICRGYIRADERGLSDSAHLYHALARAEAVAARLVEVICEQESEYDVAAQYFRELREYDRNLIRIDEREQIAQEVRKRRDHFIRVTGAEPNGIVALVHDDIANAIERGEKYE